MSERPLTPEEAQAAYDAAPAVPLGKGRIEGIVRYATDPYERARQNGRLAAARGGDWRDNPHLPGTREWFEFEDGLKAD